jgi:hypothetical protein
VPNRSVVLLAPRQQVTFNSAVAEVVKDVLCCAAIATRSRRRKQPRARREQQGLGNADDSELERVADFDLFDGQR